MAYITLGNTSNLGSALQSLLISDEIVPGSAPSYELAKVIYEWHPLGGKMADAPISMAQSQPREISVPTGPEDRLKKAFEDEWRALSCDKLIANLMRLSRVYGIASIALMPKDGGDPNQEVKFENLYKEPDLNFNVFDPLNTSGSLVLSQQPNSAEFLKVPDTIRVSGQSYHRTRTVVKLNEEPIYLGYTTSAYGYVGRSVYQRALFPLRSYVQSMKTDDLIVFKSGVIVAKMNPAGSIVSGPMQSLFRGKRDVVKQAQTGNVISISPDEEIESLNLQNLDGAYTLARTNILKNIATAADMPARLLENETLTEGFGEGVEDAKAIASYIDRIRIDMQPIYEFFDNIVQWRAWNPDFYAAIQADFPEDYGGVEFKDAFFKWRNAFVAQWPNLLTEPDSEKAKNDDIRMKGMVAWVEALAPILDPENKAVLVGWVQDNLNEREDMFPVPLLLDLDALAAYEPPVPEVGGGGEPKPKADSARAPVKLVRR